MRIIHSFWTLAHLLSRWLNGVAIYSLASMMFLVCFNVVVRRLGWPIFGTIEIVEFLTSITIAFALPYTSIVRGHIAIDLLVSHLPKRVQTIIDGIICFISTGLFLLLAWQFFLYAKELWSTGTVSPTLKIPLAYFVYSTGFCFAVVCLAILADFFQSLLRVVRK